MYKNKSNKLLYLINNKKKLGFTSHTYIQTQRTNVTSPFHTAECRR